MLRVLLVVAVAAGLLGACGGDAGAPELSQPNQTGTELTRRFVDLIAAKDVAGLQAFVSDAFVIQRADGTYYGKDEYLTRLPELGRYEITDVVAMQEGETLVVRWNLAIDQVIEGRQFRTTPAPRLSTFVWSDGAWRITSHANFNAPEAAPPGG